MKVEYVFVKPSSRVPVTRKDPHEHDEQSPLEDYKPMVAMSQSRLSQFQLELWWD